MSAFFSIIYVHPNEFTEEQYAIGLLFGDENKLKFNYHAEKLRVLDRFCRSTVLGFSVLESFKSMEKQIIELNSESLNRKLPILCERHAPVDYITYLSRYSKGILQFSEATPITLPVTNEMFQRLFDQFILIENKS